MLRDVLVNLAAPLTHPTKKRTPVQEDSPVYVAIRVTIVNKMVMVRVDSPISGTRLIAASIEQKLTIV